jgi:hypothetical protein
VNGRHVPFVPLLQQPLGQVKASHAQAPIVVSQLTPLPHGAHCAPAVPHDVLDWNW